MATTTYIVLEQIQAISAERNGIEVAEGETAEVEAPEAFIAFRKIGAVNAHSTEQALRMGAEQNGGGHIVVVSERSWKSEEFEVETKTIVRPKHS